RPRRADLAVRGRPRRPRRRHVALLRRRRARRLSLRRRATRRRRAALVLRRQARSRVIHGAGRRRPGRRPSPTHHRAGRLGHGAPGASPFGYALLGGAVLRCYFGVRLDHAFYTARGAGDLVVDLTPGFHEPGGWRPPRWTVTFAYADDPLLGPPSDEVLLQRD